MRFVNGVSLRVDGSVGIVAPVITTFHIPRLSGSHYVVVTVEQNHGSVISLSSNTPHTLQ